jgi:hypothetical protein
MRLAIASLTKASVSCFLVRSNTSDSLISAFPHSIFQNVSFTAEVPTLERASVIKVYASGGLINRNLFRQVGCSGEPAPLLGDLAHRVP